MLSLLIFYFLWTTPREIRIEPGPGPVPQAAVGPAIKEAPLDLPDAPGPKPVPLKFRKVEIEIDAKGKVSATSGKAKLAAFDATQKGKMKPLADWLAKIAAKNRIRVAVSVDGDALQQQVTDLLNVLAGAGITEIVFTDLVHE